MSDNVLAKYQASITPENDKELVPDFVFADKQEATSRVLIDNAQPATIIATNGIRRLLDGGSYLQLANTVQAPGVDKVVLTPDFHRGYGVNVGSVFSSRTHIYPAAVGPDISCSMAFMVLDIPSADMFLNPLADRSLRRQLINAISDRIPSGPGAPPAKLGRKFDLGLLCDAVVNGATGDILSRMNIDPSWAERLEDKSRGNPEKLAARFAYLRGAVGDRWIQKLNQIGSLGGGNHFLECDNIKVSPGMTETAAKFGIQDGAVGVMTHCGSRGFGFTLTESKKRKDKKTGEVTGFSGQFEKLGDEFRAAGRPFPGNDPHMVYAEVGTPQGDDYLSDMYLGANFAIINHLLLMALVEEAFQVVIGVRGRFVYHIAHNIIREENDSSGNKVFVHRKGTTRAFPGFHYDLKGTPYDGIGHPVLLPGNCETGSVIMIGAEGAKNSLYSVNHGAGRAWSRAQAKRELVGVNIGKRMEEMDILTNCRNYPLDEAADAYKDFNEVIKSVELADLAKTVARLSPQGGFVFKDSDDSAEGKA